MQFYWIFTLIAGVIILAFLVSFGLRFKEVQEDKTTIIVLNNLEESFSSLQGAQFQTSTSLNVPVSMDVSCDEKGKKLVIDGRELSTDNIIFSSGELKGNVLIGFSPHKLPFKVANFFYIIKDKDTYSFVYQNNRELVEKIGEDFEDYFPNNVEITNSPSNTNKIYFYRQGNFYVIPETEDKGKVYINGEEIEYYNKAMLYGIIISQNDAECLLKEVDLKKVIDVYRNKINNLPSNCNYNGILLNLQKLENGEDVVKTLENQNQALLNNNCPLVF